LPIVLGAAQPEQVTSAAADQLIFFAVDANPSCESSREQHPLILSVRLWRAHPVDHAEGFLDLEVWRSDATPARS
jgi:hypothetical protein